MNSRFLTGFLTVLTLVSSAIVSSSPALASSIDIKNEGSGYVSSSIAWSPALVLEAKAHIHSERATVRSLFSNLAKKSNVLHVKKDKVKLESTGSISRYSFFKPFNHAVSIEGYGDWGAKSRSLTWQASTDADLTSYLATIREGVCRLSWSLFNPETWFSPDCRGFYGSAESYLRTGLIQWLENAPAANTSAYFLELSSLESVSAGHVPYSLSNGIMYSEGFDPIFAVSGIKLDETFSSGGWIIAIDPEDKWHFTFTAKRKSVADWAATGRFVTADGQTFLSFGQ